MASVNQTPSFHLETHFSPIRESGKRIFPKVAFSVTTDLVDGRKGPRGKRAFKTGT